MSESYVIIGDGIAGSSAAEAIHEEAPEADVTVVTEEGETLYNRILIKEFAKGKLPEAPISIHDPDWYDERDIDIRLNTLVTGVNPDAHTIETHEGDEIGYDKLLVAAGGTPNQLPVENADAEGVHHFWTFEDARGIREHADEADTGVVVGAGLLGIDLAAICGGQDVDAKYLMRGNRWWRYALSEEGAEIIHDGLREKGVEPVFESGAGRFETDDDGEVVATVDGNGDRHESDFVGVAIGLDFNVEILQDTEATIESGVHVDEYMRTEAEDIYAAGDITQYWDTILDERAQNGSWGSAKQQGALAGKTMLADSDHDVDIEPFRWVSSYSITHFEFPFLSFGFPTMGDESCERHYGGNEWRRLTFKDGQLIGGVLIGNLAPQSKYKQLIKDEAVVADQQDVLLQDNFEIEELATATQQ